MDDLLSRIDLFCDAVPRTRATVEDDGPLRLFLRTVRGGAYYARPIPGAGAIGAGDVERMRSLMRLRSVPEAFEWVHAAAPTMEAAIGAAGVPVQVCPLLVLDGEPVDVPLPPHHTLRLLGPLDGDLVEAEHTVRSVAAAAFGAARPGRPDGDDIVRLRDDLAAGLLARALVTGPDGPVAAGAAQRAGDVVELVGIATLPAARGQGLAGAVTSALAAAARAAGADVVFLSAVDDRAARVYERVAFRRIGTCGLAETPPPP